MAKSTFKSQTRKRDEWIAGCKCTLYRIVGCGRQSLDNNRPGWIIDSGLIQSTGIIGKTFIVVTQLLGAWPIHIKSWFVYIYVSKWADNIYRDISNKIDFFKYM